MRKSTLKFCEDAVLLDGSPFDRSKWPLLSPILEAFDNNRGAVFLLLGSIQSWKTLAVTLYFLAAPPLRPGRFAWYTQTKDAVEEYAEKKFNPLFSDTPAVTRLLPRDPRKNKTLTKIFPHMSITMLSAGTRLARNSMTLSDICCDEAWAYAPGELTEIRGRYTSYIRSEAYRLFIPTSAPDEESEVTDIWRESDQRLWHVACPHCCAEFYPEIYPPDPIEKTDPTTGKITLFSPPGGLRYISDESVRDNTGRVIPTAFASTIHYQCPSCAAPIHDLQPESGRYIPQNPHAARNTIAWKWNALCHLPLSTVARLKLDAEDALARGDPAPIEDFDRKRAVRPWSPRRLHASSQDIGANAAGYALRDPWPDEYIRLMTIDVQQDHYWWLIRLWSRDTRSRLWDCGRVFNEFELRKIQREAGIIDHGGDIRRDRKTRQWIFGRGCGVFVDGNYQKADSGVNRMCAHYHWAVLRGEPGSRRYLHHDGKRRVWAPMEPLEAFEGLAARPADADLHIGEIKFSKNEARNVLRTLRGVQRPVPIWTYPSGIDDRRPYYREHLAAWVPIDKRKNRHTQETTTEWQQLKPRDDLEWCECAQVVAASMSGLIGSDALANPEQEAADQT